MRIGLPRSLIARILLAEIATILLASVLLWQVTAGLLGRTVDRFQERGLTAQAFAVLRAVAVDRGETWSVRLPAQLKPIYDTGYDGRAYMLLDPTGRLLSASRFNQPQIASVAPRLARRTLFHQADTIGLSLPASIAGRPLWVVVTLNERGPGAIIDDVARAFLIDYIGILLGLLILLPMVNAIILRRVVRAVTRVSQDADGIGTRALDRRLDETGVPSEVVPLVRATNDLLDRLGASFSLQSEFSANVAHELRTPLATLKAQLDALEDENLRAQANLQADRIAHILSQLRDLAALEVNASKLNCVDLSAVAIEVIARLAPRAMSEGHDLAFEGDASVTVRGNSILIELALVNLVDNAIKHTPVGTIVTVIVSQTGFVDVRDDGPGVSEAQSSQLTRRFWRADWSRTDSAGLGLSIVQRIMDVHGGKLDHVATVKGACFRLVFGKPV